MAATAAVAAASTYMVFDLDETLAEVFPLFSWLDTFHGLSPPSRHALWDAFVDALWRKEEHHPQILRPGILQVMEELAAKQRRGEIRGVVIYSNSTYLESLHVVCELIHRHLGSQSPSQQKRLMPPHGPLILDCVHWNHVHRREEKKNHTETSQKSWEELRTVMIHGRTGAPDTIQPSDVYFFDDRIHTALFASLPLGHYIQVPAYQTLMSQEDLAEVMREALATVPRPVSAEWRHRIQSRYHQPMVDPVDLVAANGRSNESSPLFQERVGHLEEGQERETGQEGIRRMLAVLRPPFPSVVRGGHNARRRRIHRRTSRRILIRRKTKRHTRD